MSCVTCHVPNVMCHLSRVTCQMSKKLHFFYPEKKLDKAVELVGGGSVINGAYPVQFVSKKIIYEVIRKLFVGCRVTLKSI